LAMKRHAEIANTLRESGWQVAERITAPVAVA
jgi:ABC-type Fe3+ transport system permease subunit